MTALESFHFLRPLWLLALLPAVLLVWRLHRAANARRRWHRIIAPHLLAELLVGDGAGRRRVGPVHLLAAFLALATLALAGPSWERAPAPFAEDQAALVIALAVTPTMLAQDVRPSRLERAVHKIHDLGALRQGGRTALVAYAGSAHRVMPLTRDTDLLETFAAELSPELMPLEGNAAADAVALANDVLARAGASGSILLVADAVPADQWAVLREARRQGGAPVHVLAVAAGPEVAVPAGSPPAPPLDAAAMADAARAGGGQLEIVTVDDADVTALSRSVRTDVSQAAGDESEAWRDAGTSLLPAVALLVLVGFRRGFVLEESA